MAQTASFQLAFLVRMDPKTKAYILTALRRIDRWSKDRRDALKDVKRGQLYPCAHCKKEYGKEHVYVDHIEPVSATQKETFCWNRHMDKLFVSKDKRQVLCKICHQEKTKRESDARKEMRKTP